MGLQVDEAVISSWTAGVPPRAVLASVINREWSKTWLVPDDIFAESARRLSAWATVTFGADLDSPQIGAYSFKAVAARGDVWERCMKGSGKAWRREHLQQR